MPSSIGWKMKLYDHMAFHDALFAKGQHAAKCIGNIHEGMGEGKIILGSK